MARANNNTDIVNILTNVNNTTIEPVLAPPPALAPASVAPNIIINEEFNFETQDIDERTFNFQTCRDIISQEDENINEYLADTDTFLFINGNPNELGLTKYDYDLF
jgi:hypothetical protein